MFNHETNYFIEVHPGQELHNKIMEQKAKLKVVPGSKYVADEPHLTLIAARTKDMDSLRRYIRELAKHWEPFDYKIVGLEETTTPDGLVQIAHAVDEDDRFRFVGLHYPVIGVSLNCKSDVHMKIYDRSKLNERQLELLDYCGFPFARELFYPHVSLGRFQPDRLEEVRRLIDGYNPVGKYRADRMIIWKLPEIDVDPVETPNKVEEFLFGI